MKIQPLTTTLPPNGRVTVKFKFIPHEIKQYCFTAVITSLLDGYNVEGGSQRYKKALRLYGEGTTGDIEVIVLSSIHSSIHSYIYPSIYLSIHTSIHSYIYPFIHPSIHTSIHSYIYLLIHLSIHTSIHSYIYPFIHSFIHPIIH